MLCKYKDIFGKPNKGVHSYRIFGFASVDLLSTILICILLAYLTDYTFLELFIFLMLISFICHKIF